MPNRNLNVTLIPDVPELMEAVRCLVERLYPGAQYASIAVRLEDGLPDAQLTVPMKKPRWPRTGRPTDPNNKT